MINQQYLRLEVSVPTTGLPNLIANPNGDKGAWGWLTPVNNTAISTALGASGYELTFKTTVSQAAYWTSDFLPVNVGDTVAGRIDTIGGTATYIAKARFEYYNSSKTLLSSGAQTTFAVTAQTNFVPAVTAPASTAYVKLRFDFHTSAGGNPAINTTYTFRQAMVTTSATPTVQGVRTNLVPNPSFEVNVTGWSGPVTRSSTIGGYSGSWAGRIDINEAEAYTPANIPVTGGKTYTLSMYTKSGSVPRGVQLTLRFYNASGVQVSSSSTPVITNNSASVWTRRSLTATAPSSATMAQVMVYFPNLNEFHYIDGVMLEQVSSAGAYFDGSSSASGKTYAWSGTAHNSTSTETTSVTTFDFADPYAWQDILGPAHEIKITRSGLDVGLLSATILDAALDPADAVLVRPGKKIRLRALVDEATDLWENVYEGKLNNAQVTYPTSGTRIELTASDNIAHLSNQTEAKGVYNVTELPYLLENKGVPWMVNDSGNQVTTTPTIVSKNENASMLDQIAITRDSISAYAWVDRNNVLNAKTRALMATTAVYTFSDVPGTGVSYTDIDVNFDTEACINDITVQWLRYIPGTGQTETILYGPYKDQSSIDTWGAHTAEFTLHGPTESTTVVSDFATGVLTQNATPTRRARSLVMPVRNAAEVTIAARLDLYMPVAVEYSDKIDATLRATGIEHNITPDKWSVTLSFDVTGSVAAPQETPDPAPYYGDLIPFTSRYKASAQTIPSVTETTILWGESVKTDGITYGSGAGTFTILKPGRYLLNSIITWATTSATGRRVYYIYINAVAIARVGVPGSTQIGGVNNSITAMAYLVAGDVVEFRVVQASGAGLDTVAGQDNANAQLTWLGA